MSNNRYTQREDNAIFKFVDENGIDADITELAEKLGRSIRSVRERIKNLHIHNQVGDFSKEENKLLLEKVKPYVDAGRNIPWTNLSQMYFYKPRRSPGLLRRKYKLLKLKQLHGSDDSDESVSQETSSASVSDIESEEEQPKPELNFLTSSSSDDDVQEITAPPAPTSPAPASSTPTPATPAFRSTIQGSFNSSPYVYGPRITVWDNEERNQSMFTLNVAKTSVPSKVPSFHYVVDKTVTKPHIMVVLPDN